MKKILENETMETIQEWFDKNGYRKNKKPRVGLGGYYCKGYQDADLIEITENANGTYNLHI